MFTVRLPDVKEIMTLVAAIHDARFPWRQNPLNERPFGFLAVAEKDLLGNAAIEIETDVNLGLLRVSAVVGPIHG